LSNEESFNKVKKHDILEILFLLFCVSIFVLPIYLGLILIDSFNDVRVCKDEFVRITPLMLIGERVRIVDVFANSDYFNLNLGQNIYCSVYWKGTYLTHVDFFSEELTIGDILNSIYWRQPS
jgi:hypothetical protein